MRLFSAGTFYLSRSSSLAAEYLCDRDTISQHRNTGLLLSTVIQMHTMERDTQLYLPDISVYDTCEDVCDWLHASAHNVAWMIDYFEQLDAKCVRMFDMNPLTWDFKRKLRDYVDVFDNADTTDDWLPLSTSQARDEYISEIRRYQYRKVKVPFWFAGHIARPEPVATQTDAATPTPEASIVTAEGFTLDLSPLW